MIKASHQIFMNHCPVFQKCKTILVVEAVRKTAFSICFFSKGRIPLPNGMNFWKSAKGGGHFQSKNLSCRFWELKTGLFEHEIDKEKSNLRFQGMFFSTIVLILTDIN